MVSAGAEPVAAHIMIAAYTGKWRQAPFYLRFFAFICG
jgi:hypothetical protein